MGVAHRIPVQFQRVDCSSNSSHVSLIARLSGQTIRVRRSRGVGESSSSHRREYRWGAARVMYGAVNRPAAAGPAGRGCSAIRLRHIPGGPATSSRETLVWQVVAQTPRVPAGRVRNVERRDRHPAVAASSPTTANTAAVPDRIFAVSAVRRLICWAIVPVVPSVSRTVKSGLRLPTTATSAGHAELCRVSSLRLLAAF